MCVFKGSPSTEPCGVPLRTPPTQFLISLGPKEVPPWSQRTPPQVSEVTQAATWKGEQYQGPTVGWRDVSKGQNLREQQVSSPKKSSPLPSAKWNLPSPS